MFTKEYVREVLEQMCAPYMTVPLSDVYVQKIYDDFVKIRNGEAVEQSSATRRLHSCICGDRIPLDEYRCLNCQAWETTRA